MARAHRIARVAAAVLCLSLGTLLAACGDTPSTSGVTSIQITVSTSTATDTPAPTPTATVGMVGVGGDPCTQPSAETASYLSANQIPTPSNTGFITTGEGAADGVQQSLDFQDADGCAQGVTPAQITAFYTAQMPSAGWKASTTQPPCQGTPCWTKVRNATTTTGITLEHVKATSNGATTFTLHIVDLSKNS